METKGLLAIQLHRFANASVRVYIEFLFELQMLCVALNYYWLRFSRKIRQYIADRPYNFVWYIYLNFYMCFHNKANEMDYFRCFEISSDLSIGNMISLPCICIRVVVVFAIFMVSECDVRRRMCVCVEHSTDIEFVLVQFCCFISFSFCLYRH